jgi:phosphoglucosamine mutase
MKVTFGTDGIRGRVNREPLVPETLARIGRALGEELLSRGGPRRVLMGRDTRISGPMVGGALLSGLLASGVGVTVGGVLPTPAVARLTLSGRFGMGIVVSASHNPPRDNGIKVFLGNGRKGDAAFEAAVEARIEAGPGEMPAGDATGRYEAWAGAAEDYIERLLADFLELDLDGFRIVADCGNGAHTVTAPPALTRVGADVRAIHASPNGKNINRGCGATKAGTVAKAVVEMSAELGVAFDGDGDRAVFADETGAVLDGDAVMAILARDLLSRRSLPHRVVVATVMSNIGLDRALAEIGVRLVRTDVGDQHVARAMEEGGYRLGGEQSGHILVRRGRRLVGDGLETALHLLAALRRSGGRVSELAACFRRSPQHLVNIRVSERRPLDEVDGVSSAIAEVERDLGNEGRVLVRYSGTERLARVMVEGPSRETVRQAAARIAAVIEREIGAES